MKKTSKTTPARTKAAMPRAPRRTPVEDIAPEEQIVGAPLLGKVKAYDAKTREITLELEEALTGILSQVNAVTLQVSQIATAAEEQTATTNEITNNMQSVTDAVQQTSA